MKDSLLRLLAISFVTLVVFFIAILSLNILGSQQVFTAFDHPLLNTSQMLAVHPPPKPIGLDNQSLFIPYLKVTTDNDEWVVGSRQLTEVLNELQPINLALFVNTRINLGRLVKILFELDMQERVIIFANEQKIHIELKKMAPRWLYVANPSQRMKIKIMNSFWLAPMADYSFDIYVLDPKEEIYFPEALIYELKKRHKKVLLESKSIENTSNFKDLNGTVWTL